MKPKTNFLFYILFFFVVVFAVFFFWNKWFQRDSLETEPRQTQKIDENNFYSLKKINEETEYVKIEVEYPVFKNVAPEFNNKIFSQIEAAINEHKELSEENWKARFETATKDDPISEKPTKDEKFILAITFKEKQVNSEFISGFLDFSGYTGGAHGYQNFVALNYDIKNKKEISFSDYLINTKRSFTEVQNIAREELVSKYASSTSKDEKEYNESIKQSIFDGTSKISDFETYTFTKNGATIYFGQYQVGPYVIGIPEVEI